MTSNYTAIIYFLPPIYLKHRMLHVYDYTTWKLDWSLEKRIYWIRRGIYRQISQWIAVKKCHKFQYFLAEICGFLFHFFVFHFVFNQNHLFVSVFALNQKHEVYISKQSTDFSRFSSRWTTTTDAYITSEKLSLLHKRLCRCYVVRLGPRDVYKAGGTPPVPY